jgi:hypothetical protein
MNVASGSDHSGLRGSGASLPLVDLLQVWSLNRFSGLVAVGSRGRGGKLHFAEGEIVHAEAGGQEGEPAVRVILSWSDVTFEPFPNTTTLKRTIQKRVSHLLLDAHRELDEARRTPAPEAPAHTPAPQATSSLDQLRALRGVTGVVRFGADGRPTGASAGDPAAEALAGKALYLALTHAQAVGQSFGLRDLWLAALEGPRESMIVVHSGAHYLGLSVAPGTPVDPLIPQVRALLTRPAGR